jgi:hypothetical protein
VHGGGGGGSSDESMLLEGLATPSPWTMVMVFVGLCVFCVVLTRDSSVGFVVPTFILIPSYVASFFSFNLSYVLKKTNFGLVT